VHIASAVATPVVAIYGPTVPAFGFTPYGVPHRIAERAGLACRPCAIHGGKRCPIGTLECMTALAPGDVAAAARELMEPGTTDR
jgi:heptosyltransferase-2